MPLTKQKLVIIKSQAFVFLILLYFYFATFNSLIRRGQFITLSII